jgi:hypothetical protein
MRPQAPVAGPLLRVVQRARQSAAATARMARRPRCHKREVIEMTQIKLLVIMPMPDYEQADEASRDTTFTEQVNAILRFDDGWRLTMNGAEYPSAKAEGTKMAGDADEPPVKQAIESLIHAAAEPEPEAGATDSDAEDRDAEGIKAHTQAEVLQFEVPEGSSTVQVRVEPEVVVEGGEQRIRVKVKDPSWVEDTGSAKDKDTSPAKDKDTSPAKDKDTS